MEKVYFENLNGFRGIASIAVVCAHCCYWIPSPNNQYYSFVRSLLTFNDSDSGRLGVIFFFILSGFLITYLLLLELKTFGKINVLYFFFCVYFVFGHYII
jgi:peptidoglycan/LPS O-acetylase OafA/YrhL